MSPRYKSPPKTEGYGGLIRGSLTVIKANIGGYVGHSSMHPELIAKGQENLGKSKTKGGGLTDFHVTRCGDDLQLILTH